MTLCDSCEHSHNGCMRYQCFCGYRHWGTPIFSEDEPCLDPEIRTLKEDDHCISYQQREEA